MTVFSLRPPIVDGKSITASIGSSALLNKVQATLLAMRKEQKKIFPNGKIVQTSMVNGTNIHLYTDGVRKIADLQGAVTKDGYRYFRIALFPSQFQGQDFLQLQQVLAHWLSPFTYESLYYIGKVSRLDIAIDDVLHPAHSFLPFRPISNMSGIYSNWAGQKGATYLGSRTSNLQFCIYDKTRQLLETGGTPRFNIQTRFEARLRHYGFSPYQFEENVGLPFERLEIMNLQAAYSASSSQGWKDFLALCSVVGSCKALSLLPSKHVRKKYIKYLREFLVPWWQPQKVWGKFPEAYQKLKPMPLT